jgi:hypothetical protein
LCVKGIFHTISGVWVGGLFSGEGHFQPLGAASQSVLRLIQEHRFLPTPIRPLCLRLKVSLPGVVRVPMKVIVVLSGKIFSPRPRRCEKQIRWISGKSEGVRRD